MGCSWYNKCRDSRNYDYFCLKEGETDCNLILHRLEFAKINLLKLINVFIFNLIKTAFVHKTISILGKLVNYYSNKEVQIQDVLNTILFKMILFWDLMFTDVIMLFAHWIENQLLLKSIRNKRYAIKMDKYFNSKVVNYMVT